MSKQEFWTHWIIGVGAALVWFWGDKAGIPQAAQGLAAGIVPALVTHALGVKRGQSFRDNAASAAQPEQTS